MQSKEFLISDLQHFGELFWRNEEVGEKRFRFFITLVTAIIGALVALTTSENRPCDQVMKCLEGAVFFALLVFGLLTYTRMVRRNHVTDEYKHTLTYIRKLFVSLCTELDSYKVPIKYDPKRPWAWLRGGYAQTVGFINSFLLSALIFRYYDVEIIVAISVFFSFWALQWIGAHLIRDYLKKKLKNERHYLEKAFKKRENNETT